jgi:dTDP-glucose 4,6-dehydratase
MPGPLPKEDLEHILSQTATLWEPLRGQRLFISGGTGFFGRWLLESFAVANDRLSLGAHAVVLTRDHAAFTQKAPHLANRSDLQFHAGDVRDFAFPTGEFRAIVHAATEASAKLNAEEPLLMLDTIIAGTRRMLDFATKCRAKTFLLTSSGAVYGAQPPDLRNVPEDYPGAPDPGAANAAYGEGKRTAELLCHAYSRRFGFDVKIARCFAFVGPGLPLHAHFAIGNFIRDGLAGSPMAIQGDGTPVRSYLYAADLTIWLWKILFEGTPGRAYNVGSASALSIAETAEAVRRALGSKTPITIAQKPVPGKPAARYVPDVTRATQELGLREWIGLDDAIRKTALWHSQSVHD